MASKKTPSLYITNEFKYLFVFNTRRSINVPLLTLNLIRKPFWVVRRSWAGGKWLARIYPRLGWNPCRSPLVPRSRGSWWSNRRNRYRS